MKSPLKIGSNPLGNGQCSFRVWAPFNDSVEARVFAPRERIIPLRKNGKGYHEGVEDNLPPGTLYKYRLDNEKELPDPASRFQPEGVHGPSQVVDDRFLWSDEQWEGLPLEEYLIYELHVGTFTPQGTFAAVAERLDELKDLGVTAIELMPVAQFPGDRNWGYDGVYPFACQNSYGGPAGLKKLVDACHRRRMAVVLDVVYNHLGPEGAYLDQFGPYFTDRYQTPWGLAINYDGPYSDEVRNYFIINALQWVDEFHVDALRLDAIHGIFDFSARHFLTELGEAVKTRAEELNRRVFLFPESDLNDTRVITPRNAGGYELDAQWNDDYHHALHALLTGERSGYYQDFGMIEHLAKAYSQGYVYSGQYSEYRRRRFGNSSRDIPAYRFIVCSQNHDQVGNRMRGDRLSALVDFESLKLAAGVTLLSPFLPLLFMGEEYGETAPFLYFISHGDPDLIKAVRDGRKAEFAHFAWSEEPPDPQAEATFIRSKLNWEARQDDARQGALFELYRELIRLRKSIPALRRLDKQSMEVRSFEKDGAMLVRRWSDSEEVLIACHFGTWPREITLPAYGGQWVRLLDSADTQWGGNGGSVPVAINLERQTNARFQPRSLVLFERKQT